MKKIIIYSFILLSLTGCNKITKETNQKKESQNTTITLEGNETTGYTWSCTEDNHYLKIKSTYQEEDKTDENMTGVGGKYTITLSGLKAGKTELTCQYKRSFEEEAEETRTYPIKIDNTLKVTVGKYSSTKKESKTDTKNNTQKENTTTKKELKTFTFDNAYGIVSVPYAALTATGTAGASNTIFYLKDNQLYLYGHGEEDELLANGVEKIYYKTAQAEQITVVLNKNSTMSKENSYLEYEK